MLRKLTIIENRAQSGIAYLTMLFLLTLLSATGLTFLHKAHTEMAITVTRGQGMQAAYLAESAANHAIWRLLNEPGFPGGQEDVYFMHSLAGGRYGYKVREPSATTFSTVATVGATGESVVHQSYVPYIIPEKVMTVYVNYWAKTDCYRRMVGASFDAEKETFFINAWEPKWVELEGHPFADEFVVGFLDDYDEIELGVWDGSSWGNTVEFTNNSHKDHKCFDIAYDTYNGHALVFGESDSIYGIVIYTVWDGSNWTAPALAFDTGSGSAIRYIDAEGSPTSGEILIAVLYQNKDISLHRWDGTAFDQRATLETDAAYDKGMQVDITYEQQSGEALIVWAVNYADTCYYRTWDGSTLSAANPLPTFSKKVRHIKMAPDPTSDTILLLAVDDDKDLNVAVWDGSTWTDSTVLEGDLEQNAGKEYLNFAAAWEESGSEAIIAWGRKDSTNVMYTRWNKGMALSSCVVEAGPDFAYKLKGGMRMCRVPGSDRIVLMSANENYDLKYCLWDGDRLRGNPAVLQIYGQPSFLGCAHDIAFPNCLAGPTVEPLPNSGIGAGWGRRCELVIQAGKVIADMPDFPLLLTEATLPSEMFDANGPHPALDGGGDIRFSSDQAGANRLSCEIVTFNTNSAGNGKAEIWVKVPTVSSSSNTSLWIWYEKAGTTQPAADESFGSESVWESNYEGVWHLLEEEPGTGTIDLYQNSTANINHGDDYVSATGQSGQINGGQEFSGSGDSVQIPHDPSLNLVGPMTISFWIHPTQATGAFNRIVEKGLWGYQTSYYFGCGNGTNDLTFYLSNNMVIETPNNTITVDTWQYAAVSYNSSGDATLYLDGSVLGTGSYTGGITGNSNTLYISYANSTYDFPGFIDEVRISDVPRSGEWITTEYNNQDNPSTFIIEGTPQTP